MTDVMYHTVISGSCLKNRGYVNNRDVTTLLKLGRWQISFHYNRDCRCQITTKDYLHHTPQTFSHIQDTKHRYLSEMHVVFCQQPINTLLWRVPDSNVGHSRHIINNAKHFLQQSKHPQSSSTQQSQSLPIKPHSENTKVVSLTKLLCGAEREFNVLQCDARPLHTAWVAQSHHFARYRT